MKKDKILPTPTESLEMGLIIAFGGGLMILLLTVAEWFERIF